MANDNGRDIISKHAELIGRVTLMWSDVHRQIGKLFEQFTESEDERKRYWATRSDYDQRQLAMHAGSLALQRFPDLLDSLTETLGEIDSLADDRNAAVHTYWTTTPPPDRKIRPHPYAPKHKALRDDFEVQFNELLNALSGHWLTLFDLDIDYFDCKSR
jgi:hypothetical protein